MAEVIAELIVSLDMHAKGRTSPGFFGYLGPELEKWFEANQKKPFRQLVGRKTYKLMNALPEEARDKGWHDMANQPGFLFSRTLKKSDWPALQLVSSDMVAFVRDLKKKRGSELRILGSLSLAHQLANAKLLDRMRLIVCPLALPESGTEPVFWDWPDVAMKLVSSRVVDKRVMIMDYRLAGSPPRSQ